MPACAGASFACESLLGRQLGDVAVSVPELAEDIELHRASYGQRGIVIICVNLVRLGEAPFVVETIKPIFWHA